MTEAIISLGVMGFVFAVLLAFAAKAFAIEVDPKEAQILEILPGANCGACGYPGCAAYAAAIANGTAKTNACPVGGAKLAADLANLMGSAAESLEEQFALIKCRGTDSVASKKYEYQGIPTCSAAHSLGGGFKGCSYGCLGLGDCVKACVFDALKINEFGIAEVDKEKCTGCGMCVAACPRNIIEMVPARSDVHILCNSLDRGPAVRAVCSEGCIGCGLCARNCPADAIVMENNLAYIDYDKCINCGVCAEKCPMKTIAV